MTDHLSPLAWTQHVADIDNFPGYLLLGGSAVRVVVTEDDDTHVELIDELTRLERSHELVGIRVDAASCGKLHQPQAILATIARSIDLFGAFTDVARRIWRDLGYPSTEVTIAKVAERHGLLHNELRTEFRLESRRFVAELPGLSRDFKTAIHSVLLEMIDSDHRGRAVVQRVESYLLGTLGAKDLFDLGIQRKVSKETATPAMRNLLAFLHAASPSGTLLHIDLRWATDEHLLTEGPVWRATKSQRVAMYQWVRELIDGVDRFTSTLICVEFGPQFPNASFSGRGWGLYDALRLRLEDGVRPVGGPNPSAPFVPLEVR